MAGKEQARAVALGILERVERDGAYASILLQHLPPGISPDETRLATELVYGVLRHRLHDEHLLEELAGRRRSRIDPRVALLFRLAAHQILRLDRVPDRAAVHEAVEMAKTPGGRAGSPRARSSAGFLNAVLRRLSREKESLPLPTIPPVGAPEEEHVRVLSILYSHPEWIVRRWLGRYGPEETRGLLEAGNRRAPVYARVDTGRATVDQARASLSEEGIETEAIAYPRGFLRVLRGSAQHSTAFARGWIYIQDGASGLVPVVVAPGPGARVLDGCSAPGGKSLALARMAGPAGRVIAADLHPGRARLVTENARRHEIGTIHTVVCDLTRAPFREPFDAVLVDAPCSGTGVFRRDPESKYRIEESDLSRLVTLQGSLLDAAAGLVKPGGRLVYSVCSLEPEEGEDQVRAFLNRWKVFEREEIVERLEGRKDLVGSDGGMRTLPHRHDMDGFYAGSFRRSV